MQFTGVIENINIDYLTQKPKITFVADNKELLQDYDKLKGIKLTVEAKKWHEKRSLDANSYLWVLCQKIAEKLNVSKIEVYKDSIKQIGVFDYILIKNDAVDQFLINWQKNGVGYIAEKLETSKIEGCTKLMIYYGSSTYNTYQMAKLIDIVVQLAQSLDIETKTPDEINKMKELWK